MKKITKNITALILALSVIFVPVNIQGTGLVSSAATFAQLNAGNVFLKQNTSVTCTLASAAMILRRTAIAAGYNDWEQITEENIRNVGWVDGIGLLWNFSCYNMTIGHGYFSGTDNKMSMIDLLEKYPQGVVIYNGGNSGQSHAVVLTDYDEKSDTFYAADPASSAPSGRIKLTESTIKGETQDEQIDNLTSYWYVSSPEVTYKDGNYSSGGNVGGSTEGSDGQSFYDPTSDTAVFKTTQKDVNEYYVVSDDSSQGVALRHYPSGSSSSVKSLEKGTLIYVSYEGKNNFGATWYRTSDGYYIFSGNAVKFSDYSQEVIKFNNTIKSESSTYKVCSNTDKKTAVRIEPSEGNNIIGYADNESMLYIVASGANTAGAAWLKTSEGYYVKASEMKFVASGKISGAGFSGELLNITGSYYASPVEDSSSSGSSVYRITASALNVRTQPVDGDVLTVIPNGAEVTVTQILSGWGKVTYNGYEGWISLVYAQKVSDIDNPLKIESIILSKNNIEVGEDIVCSVNVSGGDAYLYKFSLYDDSGKAINEEKLHSAKNQRVYTAEDCGNFYYKVEVIDNNGNSAEGYSGNFSVHKKLQLSSVSSNIDDYTYVYEDIVWTVTAESVSQTAVYDYSLYLNGTLVENKQSSSNEYKYKPQKSGMYVLKVLLKDEYTSSNTVESEVSVYDKLSIEKISINTTAALCGKDIICKVEATGGTGEYQYCFSVLKNGNVIKTGTFKNDSECVFNFSEAGTYTVLCSVTDTANMIVSAVSADIVVFDSVMGDVDNDGKITAADARIVLRFSARIGELGEQEQAAADVNNDGKVTATDARYILRCSAHLESIL